MTKAKTIQYIEQLLQSALYSYTIGNHRADAFVKYTKAEGLREAWNDTHKTPLPYLSKIAEVFMPELFPGVKWQKFYFDCICFVGGNISDEYDGIPF
jgi:hypothetical protein